MCRRAFLPLRPRDGAHEALFDVVGFATDTPALRETFGVPALTIVEWAWSGPVRNGTRNSIGAGVGRIVMSGSETEHCGKEIS